MAKNNQKDNKSKKKVDREKIKRPGNKRGPGPSYGKSAPSQSSFKVNKVKIEDNESIDLTSSTGPRKLDDEG